MDAKTRRENGIIHAYLDELRDQFVYEFYAEGETLPSKSFRQDHLFVVNDPKRAEALVNEQREKWIESGA